MVTVRGSLAKRNAGGPQFKYIPQRVLVEVEDGIKITDIANSTDEFTNDLLDTPPVGDTVLATVRDKLQTLDFDTKVLSNTGVIVAQTERLSTVIDNIKSLPNEFSERSINRINQLQNRASNSGAMSIVDGFRPGLFNFQSASDREFESQLRNELLGELHNPITDALEDIEHVASVEVSHTYNPPGPQNLGIDVTSPDVFADDDSDAPNVGDAVKKIGGEEAWQVDTGEGAVVAIFDTSFSEKFVKSNRVIDTFYGDDVDSAYSDPDEGHGTMTAYSAAGNAKDTTDGQGNQKVDYSGIAKDADLLLARLTDSNGSFVYTEEAWDWLAEWVKALDKPVISNHSYGVPLCSGRGQGFCDSVAANISEALSRRDDHQAVYAAGNEAQYCGHRLSGVTNAITGVNSKNSSIAVAAFRFDGSGAQTYSSHGFGTCADKLDNPKPDVGSLIPSIVPYGDDEKDLSTSTGSGAGTSEAAPLVAGVAALVASQTGNARQSVIEGALESSASLPRRTQVNTIRGHDARFGNGQVNAAEAARFGSILEEQEPPSATFTFSPSNPTVGAEVTFDASASTDPNSNIESYQWDFGDGVTATGESVTHTFSERGTSNVMLTVTDSTGLQDTDTAQVEVLAEPEAEFEISDTTPSVGEPVTFDGSTTVNPDTTISEYRWDFGDGETARGEIVQHEYESIGNYQVRLSVLDSAGSTSTINRTIEVTAVPEAGFAYEPTQPMQGQTVRFDASRSTDLDDDIVSYAWDFGDGSMSQGSAVTHEFDRYGEYPVTLTVEDSVGNTSTTTRSVQVLAAPAPSFRYQPSTPTVSDTVTLDASGSSDPDDSIMSYNWDLGQGDTAQGEVVSFSYDTGGSYDVMLTTEDEAGNTASTTQTIDVIQRPEPEFVVTPSQPLQSEVITLDASNSVDPDGEVTSYRWALGDGTEKNGEVIEHIYGESGEFDVTLRVSDNAGNSATITDTVTVYAEPNAQFEYSPQEPTTSDAVTFDASDSTDDDSEALSYTWTFSNGQTDQGRVVTKMYDSPGEYEVQLSVEDNIGNSDTATRFVVVSEESGDPGGGSGPETSSAPGVGGEGRFSTREERQEEIIE